MRAAAMAAVREAARFARAGDVPALRSPIMRD